MNQFDLLDIGLLDLLYELHGSDIRLIVGGGYGLHLKRRYLQANRVRTLLQQYSQERSTKDIDVFLTTEVIADDPLLLRESLERAQYKVVMGREHWQFEKVYPEARILTTNTPKVILDLLTPEPPVEFIKSKRVRADTGQHTRRVKPGKSGATPHAHRTPEAIGLEEGALEVPMRGKRSTGEMYETTILLPQAFTYLIMKLFAFHGREFERNDRGQAMKHAFDLYAIIAMMSEDEDRLVQSLVEEYRGHAIFIKAQSIVADHFSNVEATGVLRIREHPDFSANLELTEFLSVLQDVFLRT